MKRTVLALLLVAAGVAAQSPDTTPRQAAVPQSMTWTALNGLASDLAAGTDGAVFAVDPEGRVWLRRPGPASSWSNLPGDFRRIAAAGEKQAWAIDADGLLYTWNGTWWRPMGERFPLKAIDVAVSDNGVAYVATADGALVRLDPRRGTVAAPDAPGDVKRVAVDTQDRPWAIDGAGTVRRFDGKRWERVGDLRANDLAVANGGVWLIAADGQLVALDAAGVPRPVAARAAVVASAPGGLPWIATADGRIYAHNPNTVPGRAAPRAETAQVFTQLLNWQRVNGSARQLAISPGGAILALGREGEVWQWKGRNNWGRLPGSFSRVALDKDNTPWGIAADGRIMRYQGSYWTALPGAARDIAGGADGSVWIVQADGQPARWVARERAWLSQPAPESLRRLAIGPDGKPWAIKESGAVARFDGKQWESLPEVEAADIAIGPEGSMFVAGADKQLRRWDAAGKRWERLNGEAATVAVGPRGKPWIATEEARIFASAFFDDLPDSQVNTVSVAMANAAVNAAKVGLGGTATASGSSVVGVPGTGTGAPKGRVSDPLEYRKVAGTARDIAIGAEGSVFVVTYDGGLARWSNTRNAFLAFPGQFSRIAVAPDGKPWGITTKGEVFRHDGSDWKLVRHIAAQDIAIGFDGTVIVADTQRYLQKYAPAADAFARLPAGADGVPPTGVKVAVDPSGKPWVITADGFVARCDQASCERLPVKARSLDIGPEGSIVIVDSDRILRRWNERDGTFDRLDGIADLIDLASVGPRGKPWLLSTAAEVWASEFFMRDESRDVTTAAVTAAVQAQSATTGTTTPPVFTFLVNMTFDSLDVSPLVTNAGDPTAVVMEIDGNGNPIIIDLNQDIWTYNYATKQLTKDGSVSSVPFSGFIRSFAIGKDSTYWLADGNSPYAVYRRQGSQWVQVTGLSDCSSSCNPPTLAVGPDGVVYATSESGKLYRYDTALKRFVILTLPLPAKLHYIGVDPGNRFWAVSGDTGKIYEYTGSEWAIRNDSTVALPDVCIDQTSKCLSIGANGSVYTRNTSGTKKLVRWNATSKVWEKISSSPTVDDTFAIGPDGRPWILVQGASDTLYRGR